MNRVYRGFMPVVFFILSACSHVEELPNSHQSDVRFQRDLDMESIPMVEERESSPSWNNMYNVGFRQLYRVLDIPMHLSLKPKEAFNVNSFDEVPDSSWFTNRIGKNEITLQQARLGPRKNAHLHFRGPVAILRGKSEGVTPGLVVKDNSNDVYFLKFDLPGHWGRSSGAEIIATLILHAAGYNVPENYIVEFHVSQLKLSPEAKIKDRFGTAKTMLQSDLEAILKVIADSNGKVRAIASKSIEGKAVGNFEFEGKRKDDPNDRIPHEYRREIRGYHVFAAWLNNVDVSSVNTLDAYVGDPGKGYIKHYFIDFGTSLGAGGHRSKTIKDGEAYHVDHVEIASRFFTAGIWIPHWYDHAKNEHPVIGIFTGEDFDPLRWRPLTQNRAFEMLTPRDWIWAARIIQKFSHPLLENIVNEGKFSDPKISKYIVDALVQRQRKIVDSVAGHR